MFRNLIIFVITCLLITNSLYARNNNPEDFKVIVSVGEYKVNPGVFETANNGQLFILKENDFELRLKQDSSVNISDNPLALTDELVINKGIVGLKVASDTLYIKTKYADMRLRNATVVIKVSEYLVRFCVVKGTAIFIYRYNFIPVSEGKEIAASKDKFSNTYKFLDDLRYVWYWTTPDKEPTLIDEK